MPISRFVYDPWELPPQQRQTTFVGREQFLDRFLGAIREQEGRATVQHYILTGPRGIGKTTLLLVLRDRIRQDPEISAKWFCVQLREEEYYVHKQRDLWQLVLQALAVEERLAEAQEVVDQAQEIRDEEKSSALLVDGLRSICNRHGKRLVLLIDNFDHIFPNTAAGEGKHRKPDSEYRAFRKRLSTEGFLMLIATSVKLFEDIYGYDKGFFHFFSPVELPELSEGEVAEMLRRLGQADDNAEFLSRLERSKVNVRTLSVLTGGNPRLITMLYHILAQREIGEPVQALWETVAGLTPMLRQELADMPRQQSKTLDALLRLNGAAAPAEISKYSRLPLNVVTTQLGRLKAARYVALEGGGRAERPLTASPTRCSVCGIGCVMCRWLAGASSCSLISFVPGFREKKGGAYFRNAGNDSMPINRAASLEWLDNHCGMPSIMQRVWTIPWRAGGRWYVLLMRT